MPITLHPDGRKAHTPHLRTFRDGWRTLRFFLMYSPRWLFLYPGIVSDLLGVVGYAIAIAGRHGRGASRSMRTRCCSPALLCCADTSRSVRHLREDICDQRRTLAAESPL